MGDSLICTEQIILLPLDEMKVVSFMQIDVFGVCFWPDLTPDALWIDICRCNFLSVWFHLLWSYWIVSWHLERGIIQKSIACLLTFPRCLAAELPKYFSPNTCTSEPACGLVYLILNRLNQKCVELNFFVQRKMCRGTTDITAHTYGYNISSQLVSKKQAHQAKLQECLSLAANGQTLPKHQTGEGILQTVQWPVLLLCVIVRMFNWTESGFDCLFVFKNTSCTYSTV